MTNSSPDISFITICYNGFKDTCELIESLHKKLKSVSYEIIVVDNASREDEAAKIHELYPTVISIRSNENGGFSGGNNIGIRAAKGKYIFLINNDTYIESDEIAYLVERLESRPEIGGVSPKIRFAFPPQHIQFAGFTPLTKITLRNNMLGFDCPDDGTFDTPHTTPYLHGAAMMFKREVASIIYQSTVAATKNSLAFILKGRFDLAAAIFYGVNSGLLRPSSDKKSIVSPDK